MKVSISYPPIESGKGVPLLSQNRQFQCFNHCTYIYPMIPACAATVLKESGHKVYWDDGIAERLNLRQYFARIAEEKPDVIAIETKTPVVSTHWGIIDSIKEALPEAKIALMGDHVTALPEESLERCKVDYVLTGGDYDFSLVNLCNHLSQGEALDPGVWHRDNGNIVSTGVFETKHDLNCLPLIDRDLTKWWLYSKDNGNYKNLPGTYTMVGRDCWWHKCTFCSWTTIYPKFRTRRPESLLDEIGMLIDKYKVREVFDDTGSFPVGKWLEVFCRGMIERGYNRKLRLSCNMKFGALDADQYELMREAGFRYLLFGVESARQETLDRINKGIVVNDIVQGCRMAKKAGLEPHLTLMVGYPWETKEDALETVDLAKDLFRRGYADTLQATIVVPYPGTPLFKECRDRGLLDTEDWEEYDMRRPVMSSPMSDEDIRELTRELYKVFFTPRYVFRRLTSIRGANDMRFVWRGIKAVFGHLRDFSPGK